MINTLRKDFFAAITLKALWDWMRKAFSVLWSASVFFVFLEKGRPKKTLFIRRKFSFPYVDI